MTALKRPDTSGLLRKMEPGQKEEAQDQVVVVAFEKGIPFDVLTYNGRSFTHYDFEYCKRYEYLYYNMSGCGPDLLEYCSGSDFTYWVRPGFEVPSIPESDRIEWPLDYTPEEIFKENLEGSTVYCGICKDRFAEDGDYRCPHLYWDDESSQWVGSGSCEVDPNHHKSSFFYLLDRTQIAVPLREALLQQQYRMDGVFSSLSCSFGAERFSFSEYELYETEYREFEKIQNAVFWLYSLEAGKTTDAETITIAWISEYLRLSREAWCYHRLPLVEEPHQNFQHDLRRILKQGYSIAEIEGFSRRWNDTPWVRYLIVNALQYLTWEKEMGCKS